LDCGGKLDARRRLGSLSSSRPLAPKRHRRGALPAHFAIQARFSTCGLALMGVKAAPGIAA
jgi:hypothetical protein